MNVNIILRIIVITKHLVQTFRPTILVVVTKDLGLQSFYLQSKHQRSFCEGYKGNGTNCDNVNECTEGSNTCSQNSHCLDNDGSFHCSCFVGECYILIFF